MAYAVFLRLAAIRDLKGLSLEILTRAEKAIDRLKMNARSPGAKKLVGFENKWRVRKWRIFNW